MPEEIYYAPLAEHRPVCRSELVSRLVAGGRRVTVQECDAQMCWVVFEGMSSQLVVSVSADEKKEVGLVTFEYSEHDGAELLAEVETVLVALGFSNNPEATYR